MVESETHLKSEVNRWLSDIFSKEYFKNIDAEINGTTGKGDGHVGDICFVKVTAVTSNEETRVLQLVLKCGKQIGDIREKLPVRLSFEREIFVYSKAVPIFRQFEEERNSVTLDKFLPKCFGTLLYDKQEVIVLQNLRAIGFKLHSRYQPLNTNHLQLTFKSYGRWHGLSIAYRDQKPEEFMKLFENLECVFQVFLPMVKSAVDQAEENLYAVLKSKNELELIERLQGQFPKRFFDGLMEQLKMDEPNCALVHGDCWSNNMMFKYNDRDPTKPEQVVFLDFQASKLLSPVWDLAFHLYSTSSEKELLQFKNLLHTYYSSLSSTLKNLGSDPDTLFPYSELVRQWKKYSYGGFVMSAFGLPVILYDKEHTLGVQDLCEIIDKVGRKNIDMISPRLVAIVRHLLYFDDF